MLEFSHPQSLQSAEGNFDCASPAHWNTAKRCLSVKFLLSCIIDQISQNQPCITARQESKPKGSCPPKEQRHVFTEIQGPPTLEQKLCKSISRGHKMLRCLARGHWCRWSYRVLGPQGAHTRDEQNFKKAFVSRLASSSTAAVQRFP